MRFEFATAGRIVFGPRVRQELAAAVRALGARPLLVTGRHAAHGDAAASVEAVATVMAAGEPTLASVRAGVEVFRRERCGVVVGLGGGSAIDTAKAIAALAPNSGEPLDYLEVIGRGRALESPPAPCVAVPTTAGSGSEVTRNAVLGSREHGVKASLRHPAMLPRLALIDPELTITLPPFPTAATGMDALTQLVEPYVSSRATPLTDALCLDGVARIARALRRTASAAGAGDLEARTDMSLAALYGGLALANAGLGAIHGFAAPIGALFDAPHAAVCAALLPHGIEANLRALRARAPGHPALDRYRRIAAALTGDPAAPADASIEAVASLCRDLHIPGLAAYGVEAAHAEDVCRRARDASSMKANPIPLTDGELRALFTAAL
jgi:alcohol dehydrogenase class IV